MANLPKGALRSVKKALKAQGATPRKQVVGSYGSKQVQETGERPTRTRSYNIRVHDLVEYRPYDHSHILMDWQVGQVVGINQTPARSGVSETTYRILGPDGLGIQEIAGRNVRMISRPEGA
jgi:hypothetical protein